MVQRGGGREALASSTALSSGTYYVSQTVTGCESGRTLVSVTVNPTPSAPSASAQTFCSDANPTVANLVASGSSLASYSVAVGGSALASSTALSSGTYYVSQTVTGCESTRTLVSVTVNPTPSAPSASAQTFCSDANPTVANLVASGSSLAWYSVAVGGSALASSTALSSGTYYVSQTVTGCESTRTLVSVTVNPTPSAPSASAQTFCSDANPTVANLVASGSSLAWYNVAVGGSALASSTALSSGTYYVSQTVTGCESGRTLVSVTVNPTPSAPSASAQTFCSDANPTVANLVASGSSLAWYNVAVGGSALASSTALSSGTYYVSQTVTGCESGRTLVSVTVNPTPSAPSASAQTFCSDANPTVANLVASGSSLAWYNVAVGGSALASSTALSSGTYYVSQTVTGCESGRTLVSVTVNPTPSAPSASAQTFCSDANPTVANLVASGSSLAWYNVAVGGSALASSTALSSGTYYVSQTVTGCESGRTLVSVTVNPTPSAPSASAQTFCSDANPTVANLVASGSSLAWYNVAVGGSALASSTALSSGTYYVSQTVTGCESGRTLVSVTVNPTPSAPSASAQTFCSDANPTVANLVASGSSLAWYNVAVGGSALASSTALSSGTYYVSQTVTGCESGRTLVSVTVNPTPSAPSASAQTFCSDANPTVANLVASGSSLAWYNVAVGGSALASSTALSSGTYYVSQTVTGCESGRTLVSVTVNPTPSAPSASAQTFCSDANPTVANLVASGSSLAWYNVAVGGSALASSTALSSGTYYVSQTVTGCESGRTLVTVTVTRPQRAQRQCADLLQRCQPDGGEPGGEREQPGVVQRGGGRERAGQFHGAEQRDLLREPDRDGLRERPNAGDRDGQPDPERAQRQCADLLQ